jgi:hypothetical protein
MQLKMNIAVSLVAIVILTLLVLLFRRTMATTNERPPLPRRPGRAKPDPKYHAVSLEFSGNACEAATANKGIRVLSSTSPRIPLPECTAPECKCHFIHHNDRRQASDRRSPYRQSISGDTGEFIKERRHRGDRRSNDPQDFFL